MSTSERTFNQVRAILNKLDRSIDEAREKRTHPHPPAAQAPMPAPQPAAAAKLPAPTPPPASTSQYGRAQPLQRPQSSGLSRWTT